MISIKRYMDASTGELIVDQQVENEPLMVAMNCYRSALRAVGKSAAQACPAPGSELELQLAKLVGQLPEEPNPRAVQQMETDVEKHLDQWAQETEEYLKQKADGVKELLMILARTAESVGERDQRYANQFSDLTSDLRTIANLDDLTQVRASLVRKASELKSCVDKMTQESQFSITQLKFKVTDYETKLKSVEQLALKDSLTSLANRRCAEGRMEWYVAQKQAYCVAILDLNGFKEINDQHGHAAGDDLLKQFASELRNCMRSTDLVARWGGDEFIVVLSCDLASAKPQINRIREWVLGDYTVHTGGSLCLKVDVDASIGVAQWLPGKNVHQVIEQADAAMYLDKKQSRKRWQCEPESRVSQGRHSA
ncbi:MAG TPA: GGDEF domain-containing protein [Acidobacteriaceae bacterium]|nr:GGDEF domain-containing protein [Acidobacteriaceae bacterium]